MLKKQYLIFCKEAGPSAQSSRVLTDIFHYVQLHPILLSSPIIPAQNLSHCSNFISNGSPSRIRIVRLISLGMTTRPRSSMRRTIPVAFILDSSRIGREQPGQYIVMLWKTWIVSAEAGKVCRFLAGFEWQRISFFLLHRSL